MPGRPGTGVAIPALLGGLGLVLLVSGAFLPWLRSGRADRNSFQAGSVVRRLVGTSGPVDDLIALWPLVAIAAAVSVALFLLGLRTLGSVVAGVSALAAGAAAIGALSTTATGFAQVVILGPLLTLTGATLVSLAVLLRALSAIASVRNDR